MPKSMTVEHFNQNNKMTHTKVDCNWVLNQSNSGSEFRVAIEDGSVLYFSRDQAFHLMHELQNGTPRNDKRNEPEPSSITCYGELEEDSNFILVGTYADGTEMEDVWALDGWPNEEPPQNWDEVKAHIQQWCDRTGHEVVEISAI